MEDIRSHWLRREIKEIEEILREAEDLREAGDLRKLDEEKWRRLEEFMKRRGKEGPDS